MSRMSSPSSDLSSWMSQLPDDVRASIPLTRLAIPGTHNSLTFSLRLSPIGPDQDSWLQKLSVAPGISTFVRTVAKKWSVCQDKDVQKQLSLGIRYFDLRLTKASASSSKKRKTAHVPSPDSIVVIHALEGDDVTVFFKQVADFLDAHPGEVVFIDVQKLYALEAGDIERLVGIVLQTLGEERILQPSTPLTNLTLDEMKRLKKDVLLVGEKDFEAALSDLCWPRALFPTPWANTVSISSLEMFLNANLAARNTNHFFVSQGILTPEISTVIFKPFSDLRKSLVNACNAFLSSRWIPSLERSSSVDMCPNVIIADFVDSDLITNQIIQLNYRKKAGCTTDSAMSRAVVISNTVMPSNYTDLEPNRDIPITDQFGLDVVIQEVIHVSQT